MPAVWWDKSQPGQGLTIVKSGETAHAGPNFWGYYTAYDQYGAATWYLFSGNYCIGQKGTKILNLYQYTGPQPGIPWDESLVKSKVVGDIYLEFLHDGKDPYQAVDCVPSAPCSVNGITADITLGDIHSYIPVDLNLTPFIPKQ